MLIKKAKIILKKVLLIISPAFRKVIQTHKDIDQLLYDNWFMNNVRNAPPSPYWQYFSTTFNQWDSPYRKLIDEGMFKAEFLYEKELLLEIKEKNIEGAVVEFGVSGGWRLKHLADAMKEINLDRQVYGFDSFEGLPKPDTANDDAFFKEGMYAANIETVKEYLKCSENPHINLIKGWFSDTFKQEQAKKIDKIAFARIDCDLYHPAVECLDYLKTRLVDNGILVFDDWMYDLSKGEPKAFYEWLPKSGWNFEFLLINGWVHLFLRVRKKINQGTSLNKR